MWNSLFGMDSLACEKQSQVFIANLTAQRITGQEQKVRNLGGRMAVQISTWLEPYLKITYHSTPWSKAVCDPNSPSQTCNLPLSIFLPQFVCVVPDFSHWSLCICFSCYCARFRFGSETILRDLNMHIRCYDFHSYDIALTAQYTLDDLSWSDVYSMR